MFEGKWQVFSSWKHACCLSLEDLNPSFLKDFFLCLFLERKLASIIKDIYWHVALNWCITAYHSIWCWMTKFEICLNISTSCLIPLQYFIYIAWIRCVDVRHYSGTKNQHDLYGWNGKSNVIFILKLCYRQRIVILSKNKIYCFMSRKWSLCTLFSKAAVWHEPKQVPSMPVPDSLSREEKW